MSVERLLERLTEAWNERNVELILPLFNEDGVYSEPAGPEKLGKTHVGHDAIRQALERSFALFPDGLIVPTCPTLILGVHAISEWDFKFSNRAGKLLLAHGVDLFTFENNKIKHKNAFLKQFATLK